MRQGGTKLHPGRNVGMGSDHTIYALIDGQVKFSYAYNGRQTVNVVAANDAMAAE